MPQYNTAFYPADSTLICLCDYAAVYLYLAQLQLLGPAGTLCYSILQVWNGNHVFMSVWKVEAWKSKCRTHSHSISLPTNPKHLPLTFSHDLHDELGAGCVRNRAAGAQAQELGDVGAHGKATWQGEVRGGT